jgi:signal transduction histidine kinase
VEITSRIDENLPSLYLNRDLFSWVIENLIKNAADALEGEGGKIHITADLANSKQIHIEIQDNGKGIASRERKNIFKPGYSTKKRGWGLGLSLAKRIIEDYHGGTIQLKESQLGEGTKFRITLEARNNN